MSLSLGVKQFKWKTFLKDEIKILAVDGYESYDRLRVFCSLIDNEDLNMIPVTGFSVNIVSYKEDGVIHMIPPGSEHHVG